MEIKIYIANLAEYVRGNLVGEWVTLPMDEDDLKAEIAKILGKDEEYAIHDFEAPFRIDEYDNPFELNSQMEELEEFDDDLVTALFNCLGWSVEDTIECLRNERFMYYSEVDSLEDVAYVMIENGDYGKIDKAIINYIDYKAIARDLDCNGWHHDSETSIALVTF